MSMSTLIMRGLRFGKEHELLFYRVSFGVSIAIIFLFIATAFSPSHPVFPALEILLGSYLVFEYVIRFSLSKRKITFPFRALNLIDLMVILSLFAPGLFVGLAFLRALRPLQLLRFYRIFGNMGDRFHISEHRREIFLSVVNLVVFLFIMTSLVYTLQVDVNPNINTYLDALYFSVTTLTTTGFGDVVPTNPIGKALAIVIMVFGVSLFFNLAANIFKRKSVYSVCPDCRLSHHEIDATHCRHCGHVIKNDTSLL